MLKILAMLAFGSLTLVAGRADAVQKNSNTVNASDDAYFKELSGLAPIHRRSTEPKKTVIDQRLSEDRADGDPDAAPGREPVRRTLH